MSNTQDPIKLALVKLNAALMCHPNAVETLIEEAIAVLQPPAPQPRVVDPETSRAIDEAARAGRFVFEPGWNAQPQGDAREAFEAWYPDGCAVKGAAAKLAAQQAFKAGAAWQATTAQSSEPSADAPLLREFLAEAERAGVTHLNEYGSTELPYQVIGVNMSDGDKRLMRMLIMALGNDHPAFDDFMALLWAKNAGPARAVEPIGGLSSIAKSKLDNLQEQGYQQCGVMIQQNHADGTVTRGAVSDGGMVIWWHPPQDEAKHHAVAAPVGEVKPLTEAQARNLCVAGAVYAPDGVVARRPNEYRREIEDAMVRGLRKGEVAHGITTSAPAKAGKDGA